MTMARLLAASAAVLCLAAFTDPNGKFSIDFPDGWSAPADDGQGNIESSPPDAAGKGVCRANNVVMANLTADQATINGAFGKPWDAATWASVLSMDASKIEVTDGNASIVDGHVMQIATITLPKEALGVPAKARFVSHVQTGHMTNAGCFAPTETFDKMKDVFEQVVTSLKPL